MLVMLARAFPTAFAVAASRRRQATAALLLDSRRSRRDRYLCWTHRHLPGDPDDVSLGPTPAAAVPPISHALGPHPTTHRPAGAMQPPPPAIGGDPRVGDGAANGGAPDDAAAAAAGVPGGAVVSPGANPVQDLVDPAFDSPLLERTEQTGFGATVGSGAGGLVAAGLGTLIGGPAVGLVAGAAGALAGAAVGGTVVVSEQIGSAAGDRAVVMLDGRAGEPSYGNIEAVRQAVPEQSRRAEEPTSAIRGPTSPSPPPPPPPPPAGSREP
ncbi:hypothetical protein VOLCADRAFT_95697 [Volvox carteri f. nagariensis]|uniref:Uncharacterized protein n=1 Tax=Volvox carteri f. nagariensis TaxID=3068 RepID=D8U855_VOLCA|nr:uncharacterized protein VOLCADRAFT_95697 [Volvox carteri f. nagariensis]EFJ44082.1 hypothetical protein VOLCADRAFT_95697 [Volvox carteri f. nagariensis]|eukprot:XP_002954883.1 hypothetical protein VOLCADRAFT_95697 [Volvox carteri f. nagariensis]